jgi:capsular polysaccharide biosynthesis protein
VVLAATLAGVGVALALTLLQPSTYRASGTLVLTREGRAPGDDPTLAPATAAATELLETRGVAESVVANLRLDDSPERLLDRIDVDADPQSSLLRLSVEGDDAPRARRIAQELTEVFTVLYNTRYGPGVTVSIWEAPRADEGSVSSRPARNLALGALAGALLGLAAGSLPRPHRRRRGPIEPAAADVPTPEQHASTTTPEPATVFVPPEPGEWTVADVERLLAEQGGAFPERRDDFDLYLASFRDVAGSDGRLPGGVEAILEEEFAELIELAHGRAPGGDTVSDR